MKQIYQVIGIMSGTSLDGIDIAFCEFHNNGKKWTFSIQQAATIAYPREWPLRLRELESGSASAIASAHSDLGHLFGKRVSSFIKKYKLKPLFVASHGHTIFHQPQHRFTTQIGDGAAIAASCGLPVICDFRSADVALGGQGAPLVPIGDRMLFGEYDFCLNLGGFANISYELGGKRIAYDVCPANLVLNELSATFGKAFDRDGRIAAQGRVDEKLLNALDNLPYYKMNAPKSLGREWLAAEFMPVMRTSKRPTADKMATVVEHIGHQVSRSVKTVKNGTLLISGGGANNKFLIERIRAMCKQQIIIPDARVIAFKEALIFAFLGVLRWRNETNCLSSVTGARRDSCGGAVYQL